MKDESDDAALLFVTEQVLGNEHLLSKILSCIVWNEVIRCRAVAILWRGATLTTLVPELHLKWESVARDLREIATYIPNLQSHSDMRGKIVFMCWGMISLLKPADLLIYGT
jgi:hypothetical protein